MLSVRTGPDGERRHDRGRLPAPQTRQAADDSIIHAPSLAPYQDAQNDPTIHGPTFKCSFLKVLHPILRYVQTVVCINHPKNTIECERLDRRYFTSTVSSFLLTHTEAKSRTDASQSNETQSLSLAMRQSDYFKTEN